MRVTLIGFGCQAELDRSKQKNGMTAIERYEWEFLPRLVGMFLSTVEGFGENSRPGCSAVSAQLSSKIFGGSIDSI